MATTTRQLADFIVEGGVQDIAVQQNPHIQPGTLQPAIAGKLLDGTTNHSGAYGTAQSDGHSYYYTDIKGSKAIKDPRIGAHFGSQRHKCKSIQMLEQETATHGENVYSVDGREWIRTYGKSRVSNDDNGNSVQIGYDTSAGLGYCEIVGYFTTANLLTFTWSSNQYVGYDYKVDGGSWSAEQTTFQTGANSLLGTRYVDRASVGTVVTGQTLGIHTLSLKIPDSGDYLNIYGIELIVQDTSSTANRSKIQIPSQNVVSYGKKFTVSGTPHYDPFNGFTNGTTLFSANVDTATSLGLGTGTTWGAPWAISGSNHIRPFNGGRVVKWVASDGTIKTSVTMMPANAQNISTTDSNEITTASATNSHTINFSDDAIDHSLSEVAKTFYIREFGNGSANQGTTGTKADASMLNATVDDIAYVMDDGLTSITGDDVNVWSDMRTFNHDANADYFYFTFIGTGVGITVTSNGGSTDEYDKYIDGVKIVDGAYARTSGVITQETLAQNLPYGTHTLKLERTAVDSWNEGYTEITFHQPKMPPIPDDACILADYMLMADYVKNTTASTQVIKYISKGVRRNSVSRDVWTNKTANGWSLAHAEPYNATGYELALDTTSGAADRLQVHLPSFATQIESIGYDDRRQIYVDDGSAEAQTMTGSSYDAQTMMNNAKVLGTYTFKSHSKLNTTGSSSAIDVVTPIHTSSHYQTFETPYLHELIGGDRNMEQTNLVVTPDGKTWDEVTRDVSYLGMHGGFRLSSEISYAADHSNFVVFTLTRGGVDGVSAVDETYKSLYNKDFAIAYDRMICLRDGFYFITFGTHPGAAGNVTLYINGNKVQNAIADFGNSGTSQVQLKRGDYIQRKGGQVNNNDDEHNLWDCYRIN